MRGLWYISNEGVLALNVGKPIYYIRKQILEAFILIYEFGEIL